jgi:hypothetical protein
MKAMFFVLAAALLTSFTGRNERKVDGLWTGVYKTDDERNKVVVRFEDDKHFALFNGEVDDKHLLNGTYQLQGDTALVFTYVTPDGKSCMMTGKLNERKTFVDGVWENCDKAKGSFYLKKEKIHEMFIEP